jgi:hypothetical protein
MAGVAGLAVVGLFWSGSEAIKMVGDMFLNS